jgi:stress-induced morphogen
MSDVAAWQDMLIAPANVWLWYQNRHLPFTVMRRLLPVERALRVKMLAKQFEWWPQRHVAGGFNSRSTEDGGGDNSVIVNRKNLGANGKLKYCQSRPRRPGPRRFAMPMDAREIERLIKARIPDAQVTIRDLAGDGDHYAATVISASFKGKSRVQQHQLVYEALKGQMGGALHALALQTGMPET